MSESLAFSVINVVIANIIGAGIFYNRLSDGFLGNPVLMVSLSLIGGLIALFGSAGFWQMGATFPEAGGEYTLSPVISSDAWFLSGWLSLIVGFSAPIIASAIGFSKYFLLAARFAILVLPENFMSPEFPASCWRFW